MAFNIFKRISSATSSSNNLIAHNLSLDPSIPSEVSTEQLSAMGWVRNADTDGKAGPVVNYSKGDSTISFIATGGAQYTIGNSIFVNAPHSENLTITNPQVVFTPAQIDYANKYLAFEASTGGAGQMPPILNSSYDGFAGGGIYGGFDQGGSYGGFAGTYGGFSGSYDGFAGGGSYGGFSGIGSAGSTNGTYGGFPGYGAPTNNVNTVVVSNIAPIQSENTIAPFASTSVGPSTSPSVMQSVLPSQSVNTNGPVDGASTYNQMGMNYNATLSQSRAMTAGTIPTPTPSPIPGTLSADLHAHINAPVDTSTMAGVYSASGWGTPPPTPSSVTATIEAPTPTSVFKANTSANNLDPIHQSNGKYSIASDAGGLTLLPPPDSNLKILGGTPGFTDPANSSSVHNRFNLPKIE